MSSEASEIPVGTQFSPNLIDLAEFIKAIIAHSGDKTKQEKAIWKPPVNLRKQSLLSVLPHSIYREV